VIPEGVKERLEAAIDTKRDVYISYKKGTHGACPHRVTPSAFRPGKEGVLVETYCHTAKADRSFYLHLIARIEDHNWE
jgi:predicted DNA-binding transcriptional regulator YafY